MVLIELLQESDAKAEAVTPGAEPEKAEEPKAQEPEPKAQAADASPAAGEAPAGETAEAEAEGEPNKEGSRAKKKTEG